MKAVVLNQHGGLEQLKYVADFPDPTATEGHVVIRVKATSFNYHDVFTVRGMPGIKVPLPMIIGLDMAGEIVEAGPGVTGWKNGDRVLVNPLNRQKGLMGEMMHGGLAEKCLVAAHQLIRMPDGVSFEQAASLPVAYGTAHRMIVTHDTIQKGEKVLILGASGGVGTGCVLLAKMLGAEVIACASSADKIQRLKDLGADHVINYKEVDFSKWAIETYGKPQRRNYDGGVDVVINFTGGDTWAPTLRCVKRGGKILVCGATAGYALARAVGLASHEIDVPPALDGGHEAHFAELLDELLGWIDTGHRPAALAEWTLAKYTLLAEAAAVTARDDAAAR